MNLSNATAPESSPTVGKTHIGIDGSLLPLLLIAVTAIIIRLPDFFIPINRDSGLFAYGGWRILHGALPYADFFDNKLPGIFYLNAFALRIFGVNNSSLVIFQLIYSVLSTWVFYAVAVKISGRKAALAASLLFAFFSGSYGLAENGNYTECYVALPMLIAALLVLRKPTDALSAALAGILVAIAAIIKQPAASLAGALVIYVLFIGKGRSRFVSAAMVLIGAGAVAGLMIAWMAHKGILAEAIQANVVFNRLYFRDAYTFGLGVAKWNLLRGIVLIALPLVGAMGGIIWLAMSKTLSKNIGLLLIPWFILDMAGVAMGGRFCNHYFLAMLPSMFLLCAVFFDGAIRSRRTVLAAVLVGSALIVGPVWHWERSCQACSGVPVSSIAEREYHALNWIFTERIPHGKMLPFEAIAEWIRNNTSESDTIYVWGWETRVGFVARREFCSRYLHMHPLGATGFDRDRRIRELAHDIETRKPKYIVDTNPLIPTTAPPLSSAPALASTSPFFRLDGYEPVKDVVARLYAPRVVIAGCIIYGLR